MFKFIHHQLLAGFLYEKKPRWQDETSHSGNFNHYFDLPYLLYHIFFSFRLPFVNRPRNA